MFESHDFARLGRIAKILVLVAAIALVTVWLAGPGSSTRGHLQKWFQSAVATLDKPSPRGFEDIVARVKPAVFCIRARVVDEQASADDQDQGLLPRFGETPDEGGAPGHARSTTSQGSGFFISSDGYAVTTNHVVEHGTSITIETDDGNAYPARIVASDPQSDHRAAKPERISHGNHPFADARRLVSDFDEPESRAAEFIQIDAPVNQGNSGG